MHSSFKSKVIQFWEAFEEEEATIRKIMDDREVEGKVLLNFTESILKIAFTEVEFQMGISQDNKYELTLTPQGDRVKLIQYNYWLKYRPQSLQDKWVFHASKPAIKDTKYKVEMFGVTLESRDITLYPRVNNQSSKIELDVYSPKLNTIPDSQRYSIFFIFLDQYISELYTIEHISNIQFVYEELGEERVQISSLKEYIDSVIEDNGWVHSSNPLDGYLGYKVQQTTREDWILREDIAAGYSSCTAPISAYHFKDNTFFEKYKSDGIIFGFLFFENIDITDEDVVQFRATIEDQIISQIIERNVADCIGGATGFHFSYIDFIIYDYEPFLKILKGVLSNYCFEEVGFSIFQSGATPIMLNELTS